MTHTVGELARLTGLTARTLHHYESLGLLRPAQRSAAGYRLYDNASVGQLHAVLAYRYLGLSLKEIAEVLAVDRPPVRDLLQRQAALVEERIEQHQRLLRALRRCTTKLEAGASGLDDELLGVINAMRLCEDVLSADDHRQMERTRASLSDADVVALQAESARLMRAFDAQRERGADPASAPVLALSRQAAALRERVAGTDKALHEKIRRVAEQSPQLRQASGISRELAAYARAAREALERVEAAGASGTPAAAKAKPKTQAKSTSKAKAHSAATSREVTR